MKTILLKLSGPEQSWGTSSHFNIRHTDLYPSKSAVIGMIGAALGYRRNEDEKLQSLNQLHFAVRIDQYGKVLHDYQTAHIQNPAKDAKKTDKTSDCYVMTHDFLSDYVFVVAVGSEQNELIDRIYHAFLHPQFHIFMGRKAYPVPSDFLIGVTGTDVLSALKQTPWQAAVWYRQMVQKSIKEFPKKTLTVYADASLLPQENSQSYSLRADAVQSFSLACRKHDVRQEKCVQIDNLSFVDLSEMPSAHDAFGCLEG